MKFLFLFILTLSFSALSKAENAHFCKINHQSSSLNTDIDVRFFLKTKPEEFRRIKRLFENSADFDYTLWRENSPVFGQAGSLGHLYKSVSSPLSVVFIEKSSSIEFSFRELTRLDLSENDCSVEGEAAVALFNFLHKSNSPEVKTIKKEENSASVEQVSIYHGLVVCQRIHLDYESSGQASSSFPSCHLKK